MTTRSAPPGRRPAAEDPKWTVCPGCRSYLYLRRLEKHRGVCPECSHHLRLSLPERLGLLLDEGSFEPRDTGLEPADPLCFSDDKPYPERIARAQRATGRTEAAVWGQGEVGGHRVVVAALDFAFMGGSIGGTTGELITRAARHALAERLPLILVSASGGARMQEGALSLMQLARTAQEIGRLREAGVLCVNVNTDPTYGGATASFSVLGDIVIAEPGARVGFAGPQVIKQTIRQDLPPGFQTAEFLRDNGLLDLVVPREELRATLGRLLSLHTDRSAPPGPGPRTEPAAEAAPGPARSAADIVALARNIDRPTTSDYCAHVFDDFIELHGDRMGADDPAVVAGVGSIEGRPVVVIGHQKGHDTVDLVGRNFGMPQPWGYHKARRMMDHAERHGMPVVAFIDTPGAYPGIEAEQRGQGLAIAECILRMSRLTVPTLAVVTGEGGSGGALAFGVGNRVLILENAFYSVISPEGCSTILFGSASEAGRAAEQLRLSAPELLRLGIVDGIVPEPADGAHTDRAATAEAVRTAVRSCLDELCRMDEAELLTQRYERFRRFGDPAHQSPPAEVAT